MHQPKPPTTTGEWDTNSKLSSPCTQCSQKHLQIYGTHNSLFIQVPVCNRTFIYTNETLLITYSNISFLTIARQFGWVTQQHSQPQMGRPKKNKKICGANITQLGFIHLVCIFLVHRMRLEKDNILYGSRVKTQILNYEFESKKNIFYWKRTR